MRILYILHADFERPGIIETWAKQNRAQEAFCRPFAGEKIPSVDQFDLLIVMGGPQSYRDGFPYLKNEVQRIQEALEAKIPILGFCLGAQLIGEALGAPTEKSPHKEVGAFLIELTEEGKADVLLQGLPEQFFVVHWHNDMPGLTADAKILATSHGCPRQIVRYLPYAYGFQCHPEPTLTNIREMIQHCPEDLAPGKFIQTAAEFLKHDFEQMNRRMIHFLNNFKALHISHIVTLT